LRLALLNILQKLHRIFQCTRQNKNMQFLMDLRRYYNIFAVKMLILCQYRHHNYSAQNAVS